MAILKRIHALDFALFFAPTVLHYKTRMLFNRRKTTSVLLCFAAETWQVQVLCILYEHLYSHKAEQEKEKQKATLQEYKNTNPHSYYLYSNLT